ncbi:Ceruloplasmin [Frankliniella fusca]|uniref:Ceruloplasmin n=1 Tax=Frankliniella fusca TaxID=407009 RepID=A0AAE1HGW6_9NEOP|nr:Ceruloplasmin [Frankliniella fusca]
MDGGALLGSGALRRPGLRHALPRHGPPQQPSSCAMRLHNHKATPQNLNSPIRVWARVGIPVDALEKSSFTQEFFLENPGHPLGKMIPPGNVQIPLGNPGLVFAV